MDLNKFTEKSKTIILEAYSLAVSKKHQMVEPIHLFRSLLEDELVKEIFLSLGATIQEILKITNIKIDELPVINNHDPAQQSLSTSSLVALQSAEKSLVDSGDSFVASDKLLKAIISLEDSNINSVLQEAKIDLVEIRKKTDSIRNGKTIDSEYGEDTLDSLKKFTTDITDLALNGKLDPVIGREDEIRRTFG